MNVEPLARAFADAAEWLRGQDLRETPRRHWKARDAYAVQRAMAADLPLVVLVAELRRRGGGRAVAWVGKDGHVIEVIE